MAQTSTQRITAVMKANKIQNFDLKVQLEQLRAMNLISDKIEVLNTRINELTARVQEKDEKDAILENDPLLKKFRKAVRDL